MTNKEILKKFGIPCKKTMKKNKVSCPYKSISKKYYETCYIMKQMINKLNTLNRIVFGDDLTSYNEMARKIRELFAYYDK